MRDAFKRLRRMWGGGGAPPAPAFALSTAMVLTGCASLTNDPMQQINFAAPGCGQEDALQCTARNKRGQWSFAPPETVPIRRSDDVLHISCESTSGESYSQSVESRIGGKIVASAVFLDFGIVDAITDKHREYPAQIVLSACN